MPAWRIARAAHQALDGEGARINGGRWNPEGRAIIYAASTLALAALQYLVHVDPEDVPDDLAAMALDIPDDLPLERIRPDDLPTDWNRIPDHPACLEVGGAWAAGASTVALLVPSAVVPEEENVLINPAHPGFGRVSVVARRSFSFDPRLSGVGCWAGGTCQISTARPASVPI